MPARFTAAHARAALARLGRRLPRGATLRDLARGMNVELEHRDVTGGDPLLTAKVALAHLRERPDYYALLAKLERAPRRNPGPARLARRSTCPPSGVRERLSVNKSGAIELSWDAAYAWWQLETSGGHTKFAWESRAKGPSDDLWPKYLWWPVDARYADLPLTREEVQHLGMEASIALTQLVARLRLLGARRAAEPPRRRGGRRGGR